MLPLDGIRVIELCQFAAGPYAAMLLADMGADVIKIEAPEGDPLRQWAPLTAGMSDNFASVNRNKRSVILDLKSDEGRTRARRLILSADAVVENFRPGVLDRLGLGFSSLAAEKPALVFCSVSAFGQDGPRAAEGGFDLTMQAIAGVMSVTGTEDGGPVKCGVPIADFGTGLYAAFATLCALRKAARTGVGEHVDVSMLGATLGMAALQTSELFGNGRDPVKLGSAHPRSAPYQAFRTRDGHVAIAAGNDRLWQSVCRVLGTEPLLADPRFATNSLRARHQRELCRLIEEKTGEKTTDDWIARFTAAGVPCAPINTYSRALADPQVQYMGWVQTMEGPGRAPVRTFGNPVRMTHQKFGIRRPPPLLGEHTEEVLAEIDAPAARKRSAAR